MRSGSTTRILLAALVMGATILVTGPVSPAAGADRRVVIRAPAPPTVTFRTAPRWETIPGTRVAWVRQAERPDYDLFRYGSNYYVYNGGYWYRSNRLNQRFVVIDDRYVPVAIGSVPSDRWRSYPPGWANPKNPHYSGRHDNGKAPGKDRGGRRR